MKKNSFFAVAVIMMTLCAVLFSSCDAAEEKYSVEGIEKSEKKIARLVRCIVPRIDYTTTGVVETRAYNPAEREGALDVTSYHEFVALYGTDTVRHTYTGRFVVNAFDVKKVRYAHNSDIFKNPVITPSVLADGRTLNVVTFKDGNTHDFDIALVEELPVYERDTYQVGDSTFTLCKNERVLLELIDSKVEPTTSPDEKYNAYTVALYFQYGLSEGPDNKKTFLVRLPQVLVPKAGPDEPLPPENHDVIAFEEVNKGYDLVNDSVSNRWIDFVKVITDGTREPFPRVAFVSKNRLFAPEYQIKQVSDFEWQSQTAKAFDPVTKGQLEARENNIYVQPMTQVFTTYTDKGSCIFTGEFDGQAYFVDSLNQKHYFLYKEYTFEDDGWQRSDMQPTENFERKLLTSDILGFFNGATLARKGEIELRKVKDAEKEIIGYWYSPLDSEESGLKPIVPNSTYWTWRTQYVLFSDGSKEKVGEVGTTLNLKTITPERQVVTVTDWEISDLSAQAYNATRTGLRRDTISTGVFTIQNLSKNFVTRTNKSSDKFVTTYDGTVTFKDKYGQEVEFIGLAVKQEDKGGVATLKNLPEADDMERKSMTTTINVTETNTSTSANHTAEIEFRKAIEKEELLSWDKEQSLEPAGNGLWTSTSTLILNYKLGGQKKIGPMTITEDWSIVGEGKTHIVLDEAKAPYANFNDGNWGAPTESHPYDGVTMLTYSKTYSENYTTLTDKYTAKKTTATFRKVIDGKEISFDFLSPNEMRISHKADNLVDGKRTATEGSVTYDVYDHTGSVTAMVTGNGKSQTQSATDEKEIWVKQAEVIIVPEHPEWGYPVGLANNGATLVYRKLVGDSQEGGFLKNLIIKYGNGILVVTTHSYGMKGNNWNPVDFTYTEEDFYYYGQKYYGKTLTQSNSINSAILRNDKWEPAAITMDGSGWVYVGISGNTVNMSQNLAVTAGIKNFNGETTAENNPYLRWSGKVDNNKVLTIYNSKGVPVIRFK